MYYFSASLQQPTILGGSTDAIVNGMLIHDGMLMHTTYYTTTYNIVYGVYMSYTRDIYNVIWHAQDAMACACSRQPTVVRETVDSCADNGGKG